MHNLIKSTAYMENRGIEFSIEPTNHKTQIDSSGK
jgi:hypothetical protein